MNLAEDAEATLPSPAEEAPVTYKNTFLLIGNRMDTPEKLVEIYQKTVFRQFGKTCAHKTGEPRSFSVFPGF